MTTTCSRKDYGVENKKYMRKEKQVENNYVSSINIQIEDVIGYKI